MMYELFSQRKKRLAQAGLDDIYQYDAVPDKLRVQLHQVFIDAIGPQYVLGAYYFNEAQAHNPNAWSFLEKTLCRENGVHHIGRGTTSAERVLSYFASCDTDGFLDVVELMTRYIDRVIGDLPDYRKESLGITQKAADAIQEVNFRFRDSNFGFQYENGSLLRVDSAYTHAEIVKPALALLTQPGFEGPQAEFVQAHQYYRSGEYAQAITEAGKAFESTLKVVCDLKGWAYPKGARASDLLKVLRNHFLWPTYLDASFDQLLATLSSGLPKVRNEEGAHGQGSEVRNTPAYVAAYALHLAAAKIRLVSEASAAQ